MFLTLICGVIGVAAIIIAWVMDATLTGYLPGIFLLFMALQTGRGHANGGPGHGLDDDGGGDCD